MATEQIQRRIERLLYQIEEAMDRLDWASVRDHAQALLRLDPENIDALAYLAATDREPVDSDPPAA
jgi:cytochrome c-type biogenesis protein CcmH/NrfG